MKTLTKLILIVFAGLMVAQCSTYKIKKDMSKSGVVNKTPKWYVDYDHETLRKYQESGTAVSPDMELAFKKAILLAKAKLVDRVNGVTNCKELGVCITLTCAPFFFKILTKLADLYAAILAVTPNRIFLFFSMIC